MFSPFVLYVVFLLLLLVDFGSLNEIHLASLISDNSNFLQAMPKVLVLSLLPPPTLSEGRKNNSLDSK